VDCLKRCLTLEPDNPEATYMLGALYAQIGMYDRAKETLSRAVQLNPAAHTATFQLGLLHLTSGDPTQARSAWQPLDALPSDNFLNLFRTGLIALVEDRFAECVEYLERGIAANTFNEPLNEDMRKVQASARAAVTGTPGEQQPLGGSAAASSAHHLLQRYRQQNPR
jgi:tetratricopeptide (TPR) repeat protein